MNINAHYHRIVILLLSVGLAFWFGRLSLQYQLSLSVPELHQIGEINTAVPMVEITDIKDGRLLGSVSRSEIRLKSGSEVAVPDQSKHFNLNVHELGFVTQPNPTLKIPDAAKFVASLHGKYFYLIDAQSEKTITVPNRVFFQTEEEAVKAGYQKRTK